MGYSGAWGTLIYEKNLKAKISNSNWYSKSELIRQSVCTRYYISTATNQELCQHIHYTFSTMRCTVKSSNFVTRSKVSRAENIYDHLLYSIMFILTDIQNF